MKKCSSCRDKKDLSLFYQRKTGKRAREYYNKCKSCMKARGRKYYHKNKDRQLPLAKARRRGYYKKKREFIDKAKNKPCADCGRKYPAYVMDFDHKDANNKIIDVARAVTANWSLKRIKKEIEKCEVVCANCHRIRTHKDRPR